MPAGLSYEKSFTAAIREGVVVAIRTDTYSSRPWCRWEILEGKRLRRPIIVLDLFRKAELRLNPYGGNVPALRLDEPVPGAVMDMDAVVLAIMTEALRILVWNRRTKELEAEVERRGPGRIRMILPRSPELADIANIRIEHKDKPVSVFHPGPPLSKPEEALICALAGDLQLFAPSDLGMPL